MSYEHHTDLPYILANIDSYHNGIIKGWILNLESKGQLSPIRFLQDGKRVPRYIYGLPREDISDLYNLDVSEVCGFEIYPELKTAVSLQYLEDEQWKTFLIFEIPDLSLNEEVPNLITIDNFYRFPEKVRDFALNQRYIPNEIGRGFRSAIDFNNDEIKKRFEEILNVKIEKWDYSGNGSFYYFTQNDKLIIDSNGKDFIGLVFLNPKTPSSFGINFFQKKEFVHDFYDEFSSLEKSDFVGSQYNRLLIFKHDLLNTISESFGTDKNDSFLFQIFVFST